MSELEIWNELGNIYYNAGAFDEAVRAYHRAIELGHCYGQSFCNLADIYIRKGFFGEAILMYQKGIEHLKISVDKASLWSRLADVYLQLDRYDEAIKAYQTAVDLDPDNEELREDLAKITHASTHLPQGVEPPQEEKPMEIPVGEPFLSMAEPVSAPISFLETSIQLAVDEPLAAEMEAGSTPAFYPEPTTMETDLDCETVLDEAIPQETREPVSLSDLMGEPVWLKEEEAVGYIPDPAMEIEALLEDTVLQETQEPVAASELMDESAWLRLEGILASIPDTAAETVEETETDLFPPLPEEFRAEEDLELKSFTGEPVVLDSQMETEAALKVAAFLSDLPEADPVSPELASPCWVFREIDPSVPVGVEPNAAAEKDPLLLGSRLLSEEPEFSPVTESLEPTPLEALPAANSQSEEFLSTLEQEAVSKSENRAFNEMLVSALPANFEIPFRWEQPDKILPFIEPRMGEPMNSRAGALVRVGLHHWHQNDYEGAVQFLNTALNLAGVFFDHPFEALCYNALALVETDMGNIDEAVRAYENAACLDAEHFHPWKEIGYLYSQSNRYEEALESFKKAIEHDPNDPLSWNGLGDVYHKLGQTEDAISSYQLGNVFDRSGRETPGLQPAPKSFEAADMNPRVLEEMGNINFLNSEYDDAIHAYSDAIELLESPTDKARLWRRLGDAYHRLNEEDNAKAAYQQAITLDSAALPLQNTPSGSEPILASPTFEEIEAVVEENLPEASNELAMAAQETAEFQELQAEAMVDPEPSTLPDEDESEMTSTEAAGQPETEATEPDGMVLQPDSSEPVVVVEEQPVEPLPAEEDSHGSEPFPTMPEPALEPEPEAAYWFYKSSEPARPLPEPAREPVRPAPGFMLSAEKVLARSSPRLPLCCPNIPIRLAWINRWCRMRSTIPPSWSWKILPKTRLRPV